MRRTVHGGTGGRMRMAAINWLDGKISKENAKNIFTVRFTVKTIRLGAVDADRRR
jgi:hypothetical protein